MKVQKRFFTIMALFLMFAVCMMTSFFFVFAQNKTSANLVPNGDCELSVSEHGYTLSNGQFETVTVDPYEGAQSYLFKRSSGRGGLTFDAASSSILSTVQAGLTAGKFYRYGYAVKYYSLPDASEGDVVTMQSAITVQDWQTGFSNINLGTSKDFPNVFYIGESDGWVKKEHVIAIHQPQDGLLDFYVDDKPVQETTLVKVAAMKFELATNDNGFYVDDIYFAPTTVNKDAVITLTKNDEPLTGQTLIIKDMVGNVLPNAVVEDNGVYTVKDIPFGSVTDKFIF